MEHETLKRTRLGLHGVAELVLAGPQYALSQEIRLRVTPGGFGTVTAPDLRIEGCELVTSSIRLRLGATYAELAEAAGVEARTLRDVYAVGPEVTADEPIVVDPEAVAMVMDAFARGDAAMRAFAPDEEPVLWPEHFDVGIAVADVNYGVSPGDAQIATPYAYVGPWSPREGDFWNMAFGAARPLTQLPDVEALEHFFREGAARAAADRPQAP